MIPLSINLSIIVQFVDKLSNKWAIVVQLSFVLNLYIGKINNEEESVEWYTELDKREESNPMENKKDNLNLTITSRIFHNF